MAQRFRALVAPLEDWVQFPKPTWSFITIQTPVQGDLIASSDLHGYTHIYASKTLISQSKNNV